MSGAAAPALRSRLRAWLIVLRILSHLLRGLATLRWRFGRLTPTQREAEVQQWARQLLQLMEIRLELRGNFPRQGPMLLVANHISWLDILVMHASGYCRFVAKSDVHHWPLIGALAAGAGTLFVERASRRDAMRVVHHMAEQLRAGELLAVFPEGTTGDGSTLLPFHANLLQSAISTGSPALPLALQYFDGASGSISLVPAYIGDESLVASVWRTLRTTGIVARVGVGEAQRDGGRPRRDWAAALHAEVRALMQRPWAARQG